MRIDLGPDLFLAQYQQRPVPTGGLMIRREWFRYYDEAPKRTYCSNVIQSWDTAAKGGAQNDWSVCTTWQLEDNYFYLLDLTRGRYEYPLLRDTALGLAKRFEPQTILIEDASTGISLAQELQRAPCYYGVQAIPIHHDKIGRLFVQQGKFAAGLVKFPRNAPFLPDLEAELLTFPQGKHDDQVDSISQALAHEGLSYNIRALL
jgi:predicted phage terminase large subunit-like protein